MPNLLLFAVYVIEILHIQVIIGRTHVSNGSCQSKITGVVIFTIYFCQTLRNYDAHIYLNN